jgi:hypothetical protein
MSDDDVDHELLALLRQRFGLGAAQFICDNSVDVALSMAHTKLAAIAVSQEMHNREYSTKTWAEHELHPKTKDEATVNFIFTMDLLNFSFWSDKHDEERFTVEYKGKKWTGYWSLVASLQRALDEGIPITSPDFWIDDGKDAGDMRQDGGTASAEKPPPSWADPNAPRLPNESFDTGVYPNTQAPRLPDESFDTGVYSDPQAPRLPDESYDTGVYPDPSSSNKPTASEATVSDTAQGRSAETDSPDLHEKPLEHTDVWSDALEVQSEEAEGSEGMPNSPEPEEEKPASPPRLRCTEEVLRHVFRSSTAEEIPMFSQRIQCLREAGRILHERFDGSVITLIQDAKGSAAALVNLLADRFACFRDESTFERKKVRFLKRAQILVADLWAAFEGEGYGEFHDIDKITMFAGMSPARLGRSKSQLTH